jgi:hypothetical protein
VTSSRTQSSRTLQTSSQVRLLTLHCAKQASR